MSKSLQSVSVVAHAVAELGPRCWYVRRSWRSPSGAVLVAVIPSSVRWSQLRPWLVEHCGSCRPCTLGWVVSVPVSGVVGVPADVVARLAGCPVHTADPVPFASFVGIPDSAAGAAGGRRGS